MADLEQDFDLQILKTGNRYRVNVLQSPAGEADGEFDLPFSEIELNELFRGLGHMRKATRGAASPEVAKAREFGTQLFDKVFSGDVRDCLSNSRGGARAAGANLRIRLRLTKVPELLDLPWELLFDRRYNRFVALDGKTTLVRHLPVAEPVVPMRVEPPLRVLVAVSNPRGDLDVKQEWANVSTALTDLKERGLVQVERIQPATLDALQARLTVGSIHVVHFIGHGYYDAASQRGYLLFEATPSGEKQVGATRLADLLSPHRTLRLVVLNACEGGRASREDPFAGVAQSLVQSAIPAVVAMQFPVTDSAAVTFAGAFYGGIAEGRPVDLALAAARREVNLKGEEGDIEWATPVLYMRSDGRLFDVGAGAGTTVAKKPAMPRRELLETDPAIRPESGRGTFGEVSGGSRSMLALRKAIGFIGISLPFFLALGKIVLEGPGIENSISSYNYTVMREVFVGGLIGIAVCLAFYTGYERIDKIAATLASISAVGVALFAVEPEFLAPSNTLVTRLNVTLVARLHVVSLFCFLLMLAYFPLYLFRRTGLKPTRRKLQRNVIYAVCGYTILACLAGIFIVPMFLESSTLKMLKPVFWLESIAMVAFGASWLIKGEAILKDDEI